MNKRELIRKYEHRLTLKNYSEYTIQSYLYKFLFSDLANYKSCLINLRAWPIFKPICKEFRFLCSYVYKRPDRVYPQSITLRETCSVWSRSYSVISLFLIKNRTIRCLNGEACFSNGLLDERILARTTILLH